MTKEGAPVKEGDLIAGKYRVGRTLGEGGMGIVVAASHVQLEQPVALKFLLPAAMEQEDIVARFAREARAAARIQSEHVVRILDVGELRPGAPFMVMEYLEGEDLSAVLAHRGPLPIPQAIQYVLQSCEAIAEAHALGIIHRDLKPANLFLARRLGGKPIVKVLDFGISKVAPSPENPGLTRTLAMMGSPPYMSPEQTRSSRSVDVRTDIWSLGCTLYELLTGRPPFEGNGVPELLAAILYSVPKPLGEQRPDVPPPLEAAVMRCLEKDQGKRFPNVAELAAAIGPWGPDSRTQSLERIFHVLGVSPPIAPPASPDPPASPRPAQASVVAGAGGSTPVLSDGVTLSDTLPAPVVPPASSAWPLTSAPIPGPPPEPRKSWGAPATIALILAAAGAGGLARWVVVSRAATAKEGAAPAPALSVAAPLTQALPASAGGGAVVDARPPGGSVIRRLPKAPGLSSRPRRAVASTGREPPPPREGELSPPETTSVSARETSAPAPTAPCAALLERMSLGETLTDRERTAYAEQCHHGKAR